MRNLLLAAAALLAVGAVAPTSAEAQRRHSSGFSGGTSAVDDIRFDRRDRDRRDRRRDRDRDADGDIFIGEWPQQGDTLWRSQGFNDWWHDNPSRAFPRWVQTGTCDRMWWSGGGWRC